MIPARRTATAATVVLATAGGLLTTAATPASAAGCTSPTYTRQFFANTTFSGTPKRTDCDAGVDEYWSGSPATGVPADNFSVRWTVTRDFGSGGPFSLTVRGQDGMRVYLDGYRKIDLWKGTSTTVSKTVNLTVPAGKHTLRVDYANWSGVGAVKFGYTPITSATYDKVKPLAPTGVAVAYDKYANKAQLTWAKNKEMDLAGYRVYRRQWGTGTWTRLTATTGTAYTDSPPPTGAGYAYVVRAYDKAGNESASTAEVSVVSPDRTGPVAPTGLTAVPDNLRIAVRWNAVSDAAGYRLYEKDPATGALALLHEGTGTSFTHAVINSAHTYVVRAYDAAGNNGALSAPVTTDGVDRTAPAVPQNFQAVNLSGRIHLSWQTQTTATEQEPHFTVVRSRGTTLGADAVPVACDYQTNGSDGSYTHSCYAPDDWEFDTTYTYGVRAVDPAGNASAPATSTVTTRDNVAPRPLPGLKATPRADGMKLSWDTPLDDDITRYYGRVLAPQADGSVKVISTCEDSADDPQALLCIGVPDGETYVYQVYARDKWDNVTPLSTASQVTATELDLRAAEPIGEDSGPLYGQGGWTVVETPTGPSWQCSGDVCAQITEFKVSRWNFQTQTYEPLGTHPATPDPKWGYWWHYEDATQPFGTVSYYRVVGVLADGTETAAAHPWRIRPDLL
ncbi:fibronectin type III domain-containing protein [Streptomyces griseosporeus]|uniref:fibronectin type III domain-containing protein n=1 Tax=Streptomyces griseosporeus TaxID=1910 RepID=UPI0036F9A4CF